MLERVRGAEIPIEECAADFGLRGIACEIWFMAESETL